MLGICICWLLPAARCHPTQKARPSPAQHRVAGVQQPRSSVCPCPVRPVHPGHARTLSPAPSPLPSWAWYRRTPRVASPHPLLPAPCSLPVRMCTLQQLRAESRIGLADTLDGAWPWRLLNAARCPLPPPSRRGRKSNLHNSRARTLTLRLSLIPSVRCHQFELVLSSCAPHDRSPGRHQDDTSRRPLTPAPTNTASFVTTVPSSPRLPPCLPGSSHSKRKPRDSASRPEDQSRPRTLAFAGRVSLLSPVGRLLLQAAFLGLQP